jgi:hypothetical protein
MTVAAESLIQALTNAVIDRDTTILDLEAECAVWREMYQMAMHGVAYVVQCDPAYREWLRSMMREGNAKTSR